MVQLDAGHPTLDSLYCMTPEDLLNRLLYRDGLMLVINKPAGIAVHRGPKGGESLEDHFHGLRFGLPRDPALAHRLDRDTAGCLVLGRHRKALDQIGKMFRHGQVAKTYWAVVEDGPQEESGLIDMPLGRLNADRGWWMKHDPLGQPSQTLWQVRGRGRDAAGKPVAFLELKPLTGRTHQLRVHCATSGYAIVGDAIYGSALAHAPPGSQPVLQLLAREISVPINKNRAPVVIRAPVPEHMHDLLAACGWGGEDDAPQLVHADDSQVSEAD